ncbi:UDP-glycosyltransferase UGT5-like [Polistes fuscatus]|uniref:UDP-glycosyltransferase UGT5-like n=1 Tax=Polistes fuscatus TaxID=30207 RepID=UPI001CA8B08D|nr:UDP-glycosyltransferase UGT5-like [Polistes fuscatus]
MGTTESIFYGVPMIGIPLFGDQKVNIQNYVNRKVAISLGSIDEVTEEKLTNALKTILTDPSYTTNIKKLSEVFKDRPEPVMNKATYWVEYVIKHKNLLQSPAIYMPWWQKHLFDVYGTILFVLILVTLLAIYLIKLVLKFVFGNNRQKVEKILKKKRN